MEGTSSVIDKDYISCEIKIFNNGKVEFKGQEQEIVCKIFAAKIDEAREGGKRDCVNNICRNIERLAK